MVAFYDFDGNQTTSQSSYEVTGSYAVTFPTYSAGSSTYADALGNPQSATSLNIGSDSSTSVGWTYTSYETYTIPLDNETSELQPISHFGMFTEVPANFAGNISKLSTATSWEQGFITHNYADYAPFVIVAFDDPATVYLYGNTAETTVLTYYPPPGTIYLTEAITISDFANFVVTEYPNSFSGDWRNDDSYLMAPVQSVETYTIPVTTGSSTTQTANSETQAFYLASVVTSDTETIYTGGADQSFNYPYDIYVISNSSWSGAPPLIFPSSAALVIFENGSATTQTTVTNGFFLNQSVFGAFSFGVSDSTNNFVEVANYSPDVMGIVPNNYFQAVYEQPFYSGYSYDLGTNSVSEKSMGLFFHTTTSSNDMVESIISETTFENSYTGEPVTYPSSGTTDEIAIGGTLPVTLAGLWGFTSYYSTGSSTSSTHFYCMTGNSIYTTVASSA